MNFIRKLVGGDSQEKHVSLVPGALRLVRSESSPKGNQEFIFPEAELAIVSSGGNDQLVVRPTPDEEGDDENDTFEVLEMERLFLVDESLRIGYFLRDGNTTVGWLDLDGDKGDRYEFVCSSSVSIDALKRFDNACRTAQYQRKYGKAPTTESDLEEFNFDPEWVPSMRRNEPNSQGQSVASPSAATGLVLPAVTPKEGDVVIEKVVDLFIYRPASNTFTLQESGVTAKIVNAGSFKFFIEVVNSFATVVSDPVAVDREMNTSLSQVAFIFNSRLLERPVSFLLKFDNPKPLTDFETAYSIALWESENQTPFAKINEVEKSYIVDAMGKMTLETSDEENEDYGEDDDDDDDDEVASESTDEVDDGDKFTAKSAKNSALEVGHVNDRSYVVRGNRIGVFKNGDKLEYKNTIENVVTPDGNEFIPSKIMLHESDRQLIMQNEQDPESLFQLDIEYGKIVEKWDMGRNIAGYAPRSKFAQSSEENLLLGLGRQSLFMIDPRLSGDKVVQDTVKLYMSNPGFSAIATTENGHVAVGSNDGSIRLYNKLGTQAKTQVPSLGDKIIGIDVTSDGHWVLATFKSYLLLLEAVTPEINGFTKAFPKDKKPRPRRVQITPENAAFMYSETGQPLNFTPARFDTGPDAKEQSIVTSSGPFVITWNLKAVIKGSAKSYLIKRYSSLVTADNFKYGSDKRVVVATEDDVSMVSKSALRRPTQQNLQRSD